jgi:hypothetical protein
VGQQSLLAERYWWKIWVQFPEKKLPQMQVFLDYFSSLPYKGIRPFIFYIDARWGSLALMERIRAAQCYGVLSCSSTAKPKALMMWMRTDLGVKDWWSVGNRKLSANLITIRTKKKTYLNILTNWACLDAETVNYRKRKHPAGSYTVVASAVQKEYNTFKAKVDIWNKSLLLYYRHGQFTGSETFYTRFFFHAWTLQAYHLYKASSNSDISQLEFRKRLIGELYDLIFGPKPASPLVQKVAHWPRSQHPLKHKCQIGRCGNSCTYYCDGCKLWGCLQCLTNIH